MLQALKAALSDMERKAQRAEEAAALEGECQRLLALVSDKQRTIETMQQQRAAAATQVGGGMGVWWRPADKVSCVRFRMQRSC